jgi:hypothetical protein
MSKLKLFITAFTFAFISTAFLCIIAGYPLIFPPVAYNFINFILFAILIAALCFGLVYINFAFLKFIKRGLIPTCSNTAYYIIGSIVALQVLTLLLGYTESSYGSKTEATVFYYYKGVGNSLIYVLTGNLTAIIVAKLYADEQDMQERMNNTDFEFEK